VAAVPVVDWDKCRSGDVWVIGRKGDVWVTAYQLAVTYIADWTAENIAITSAYAEVKAVARRSRLWLHRAPRRARSRCGRCPVAADLRAPTTYDAFLREKVNFTRTFGFDVPVDELHVALLPHQRDIVRWALAGGRRAIFAAFGLGKSVMQLEVMRQIGRRDPDVRTLIIAPLGVRQEFIRDARLVDIDVRFIRRTEEVDGPGLYLTNYESVRDAPRHPTASPRSASTKRRYFALSVEDLPDVP